MKKRCSANAVFVLVLLAGCSTTTYYRNALHPEYGQVQYDRDVYECRRENTGPVTSSYAYGYARVAGSDSRLEVNEEMARQCLAARGWREASAPAPAAPSKAAPPSTTLLCGDRWEGNVPVRRQTTCLMVPPTGDALEVTRKWTPVMHYGNMELCETERARFIVSSSDAARRAARCVYANDPRLR